MSTLSSQPYKGTRDYYPEEKRVQNYIFDTWKSVSKLYGYEEYGAPMLEPIEVYLAKSGEELASQQTYSFTDRGGRAVAIRPEMTPSISRMVAARRQELAYPARLFSIANFMRYERPQRGREREFWQLNVDIFGAEGAAPEAEIIAMGVEYLKKFGADDTMFEVKINSRKVIDWMMRQHLGLEGEAVTQMIKLFDRKNKITPESFRDQAVDIFGRDSAQQGLLKISELLLATGIEQLPEALRTSSEFVELEALFDMLEAVGVTNAVFDCTLMRGLDYYTGTVFEFFDTHPENNRSLFGGGRYDGLVGLFGAEPISAVGMAPGLTMTELFLQIHNLVPAFTAASEVCVIVLGEAYEAAAQLAKSLREEGVVTEIDFTGRKLEKQLKAAAKKQIQFVIFVGDTEQSSRVYPLKDIVSGVEQKLSVERIVTTVKDHRRSDASDADDLFE
jgi:histidyl-tRNA synthetase